MKKVLFLMFLLFLMSLGAANIKAQVRIGGSGAPNAAAVLDLNVDDSDTGNKGALALPRVSLANATAQLNGSTPLKGMLVYNTGGTMGAGVYYWNGTAWALLLPLTAYTMWTKSFDGTISIPALAPGYWARPVALGVAMGDICVVHTTGGLLAESESNTVFVVNVVAGTSPAVAARVTCYRPSS